MLRRDEGDQALSASIVRLVEGPLDQRVAQPAPAGTGDEGTVQVATHPDEGELRGALVRQTQDADGHDLAAVVGREQHATCSIVQLAVFDQPRRGTDDPLGLVLVPTAWPLEAAERTQRRRVDAIGRSDDEPRLANDRSRHYATRRNGCVARVR